MTTPRQHAAPTHQHAETDGDPGGELLDLDADVLAGHLAALVADLPVGPTPRRILDLGAGTGSGTFALLTRFPGARVTAVDVSGENLRRLRANARDRGVQDRVHTVEADLDDAWPDLGTPDLVWASASVHHLADPDRALAAIRGLLAPDGLFALVELTDFPRFFTGDAPEATVGNGPAERPGLEERCHDAMARVNSAHVPHLGADWGAKLTGAGFTVVGERDVAMRIERAESPSVGRYAFATLRRIRETVGDHLAPADLSALDALLETDGPHSVLHRDDVTVRTERQVWAARP